MTFEHPIYLLAGAIAALGIVAVARLVARRRRAALARFAAPHLLPRLSGDVSTARRATKTALLAGGIFLLFAALARPQWGTRWEEVSRRGIDVLMAVDTSRSMLAEDVAPNRLKRAKLAIYDFVTRLDGDRVGLLPFAGQAFVLCPLTLDYGAFLESLEAVDTGIIPEGGTDIAAAIRAAQDAFSKDANHKILVLITDGEDLEGAAMDAARDAAEQGVTIHTVGVGTPQGEVIPLASGGVVTDAAGQVVTSALDEDTLRELAALTGGVYEPLVSGAGGGLDAIYQRKLALVPKEELSQRMKETAIERFAWPLGIALVLLGAEFLIGTRRRIRNGSSARPAAVAVAAAVAVLLAAIPSPALAEDPRALYNSGVEAFNQGDLAAAESAFRQSLQSTDLSLQNRAYYNLGTTLYRQAEADPSSAKEKLEAAIDAFKGARMLDPEDADAAHNQAVAEKKLEELEDQQQDEQQDDSDQDDQEENEQDQQEDDGQDGEEDGEQEESGQQDDGDEQDGENGSSDSQDGDQEEEENPQPSGGDENQQEGDDQDPGEGQDPGEPQGPGEEEDQADSSPDPTAPADQVAQPSREQRIPGQMTHEEARQLLESLTSEDGDLNAIPFFIPRQSPGRPGAPKRDW
ncbi:hypothetical protein BH23VER1_BH23VER1_07540 [soil metagenome]